ncbi:MAG: glycosyltransferase family 39 protein [Anaerolineae bacterium]|jgi:hypothetical protein|nr:glycosyltransferase family 39 protein [Anaerolineae bacterium]
MTLSPRALTRLLLLALLLLAAAVRLHHLGVQSFWYDEGVAYGHSQRTLAELIPALQRNVHVPGYFGLLALYEDFTGSSEFALRSLSVWFSLLSVALTYALGRRLYGVPAGLAAAAFVTLNTFSITYAQETRMYAMQAAVSAASMWLFVGFWRRPTGRNALYLGLCNALGLYTHVSYALVLLAQGGLAVLWLLAEAGAHSPGEPVAQRARRVGRGLALYCAANLLSLAFFLPWAGTAVSQVGSQPNISDQLSLDVLLRTIQGWYAAGITFEDTLGGMGAVIYFLLLFGLVLLPGAPRRAWWSLLLPPLWVVVSTVVYVGLGLYARYLRFLIPAQIGFALWLSRGIMTLWTLRPRQTNALRHVPRVAAVVASAALMLTLANGLAPLYDDPRYQRDDYRGLAAWLARAAVPDDAIILSAPGLQEIFGYYYRGTAPVYPLPAGDDLAGDTRRILAGAQQLYVVLYGAAEQDPQGVLESTLNAGAFQLSDTWWDDLRVVRYVTPGPLLPPVAGDARFGAHIRLTGYALSGTDLHPGDVLQVQLTWQTDAPLTTRYKVFVQLLNADGGLVAQRDSEPGGGAALTTAWPSGTPIEDRHALLIPPEAAPGPYRLIVGLYDLNDAAARLPVNDTDALTLADITLLAGAGS